MGFFGSIFSGVKKAVGGIGSVVKSTFPTILSAAKNFIPGGGILGTAIDSIAGKGKSEELLKVVKDNLATGTGSPIPPSGDTGVSPRSTRSSKNHVRIWTK